MCRTALGALNQTFKWESTNRIRLIPKPQGPQPKVTIKERITTAAWADPRVKILGSKGFEAPTNTTGNACADYTSALISWVKNWIFLSSWEVLTEVAKSSQRLAILRQFELAWRLT